MLCSSFQHVFSPPRVGAGGVKNTNAQNLAVIHTTWLYLAAVADHAKNGTTPNDRLAKIS